MMLMFLLFGGFSALSVTILLSVSPVYSSSAAEGLRCLDPPSGSELFIVKGHHDTQHLKTDQASLTVISKVGYTASLCVQSDVCHKCALLHVVDIYPDSKNETILVYTAFPISVQVTQNSTNGSQVLCRHHAKLEEYGRYSLWINPNHNQSTTCNFVVEDPSRDSFLPIYISLATLVGIAVIWIILKYMYRRGLLYRIACCMPTTRLINNDLGTPTSVASEESAAMSEDSSVVSPPRQRLRSLDAFRGFSLMVMIFVNYRGGDFWFFHHSAWDGLTVADLVFPWFVFIMGTSIAIALRSQLRKGTSRKVLFLKVIKRTLILFALGLLVTNHAKHGRTVELSTLRIPGVLQRLASSYFIVASLEVAFAQPSDFHQHKWWAPMRDVLPFWPEWLLALSLLGLHLGMTFLLPVDGCPTGYLGPGGLSDNASHINCTGGASAKIDRWVFGDSHIYQHATCMKAYLSPMSVDPEGILGALTSAFLCFLGLQAGKTLIHNHDWTQRVKRWVIWSLITGAIAGGLCQFSQYDGWIPLNKNLWSVSFVLAMASMAFLVLTAFYILIDVLDIWSGAPCLYPGMNSIVVYMGHEVLAAFFPVQFDVGDTHAAILAMSLWGTTLWTGVAAVLYYKHVFIAI